jgi:hypothetical protein
MEIARGNRSELDKVPAALKLEGAAGIETTRGWEDRHAVHVAKLKRLAVALGIGSRARALEGKTNEAALDLAYIVLLGEAMAKGGLKLDSLNGFAVEMVGAALLGSQARSIDAGGCRSAARLLESAERRRERPEKILETEWKWRDARFGLIAWTDRTVRAAEGRDFVERYNKAARKTRRLFLRLAARACELDTGKAVAQPGLLVPDYLDSVPLDPVSGAPYATVGDTTGP